MANITKPSDINKIWSNAGDIISPSDTKIANGWVVEIPPRQWFNWLDNKQDQAIAHMNQHGVPVWDSVTEYQANTSYVQGSDGNLYKARQTHTNQNPVTDTLRVYWSVTNYGGLINTAVFTSSGTYTPTPGMRYVIVKVQGAGGAGAGTAAPSAGNVSLGAPGGCGAYGIGKFTSTSVGSSQTITVGTGGVGASAASGGGGGTSSFGSILTAPGGIGGTLLNNTTVPAGNANGASTSFPTGANLIGSAGSGGAGVSLGFTSSLAMGGAGGASIFGPGGGNPGSGQNGVPGIGYGSGGSGTATITGGVAQAGGAGAPGIVIIEEYA